MWRLLKIRLNEYDTPPKGMQELYERVTKEEHLVLQKYVQNSTIYKKIRK
jgi:hypothetical protein